MNTQTSEALNFIFGRRSIRAFTADPVSDETVRTLLDAAMAAPSAAARDPWRFVVVRERTTLAKIADVLPNGHFIAGAALGLVVCGDLTAAHDQQLSYLLQDCSAAIENLLLATHVLGLGGCWLGIHPREERMRKLSDLLALPRSIIPVGGLAIGWPAERQPPRTRFNPEFVHYEKW